MGEGEKERRRKGERERGERRGSVITHLIKTAMIMPQGIRDIMTIIRLFHHCI